VPTIQLKRSELRREHWWSLRKTGIEIPPEATKTNFERVLATCSHLRGITWFSKQPQRTFGLPKLPSVNLGIRLRSLTVTGNGTETLGFPNSVDLGQLEELCLGGYTLGDTVLDNDNGSSIALPAMPLLGTFCLVKMRCAADVVFLFPGRQWPQQISRLEILGNDKVICALLEPVVIRYASQLRDFTFSGPEETEMMRCLCQANKAYFRSLNTVTVGALRMLEFWPLVWFDEEMKSVTIIWDVGVRMNTLKAGDQLSTLADCLERSPKAALQKLRITGPPDAFDVDISDCGGLLVLREWCRAHEVEFELQKENYMSLYARE
jgi:hypothetical protein